MREIKFRAWDKEFKKWSEIPLKYAIEDLNYYTDYEWNQFTGLTDRNGVEIYEGDIVKYYEEEYSKVIFNYGSFCIEGNNSNHITSFYEMNGMMEVIGNIYEHPHLLEGVK